MTFHARLPDYYSSLGVDEDASLEDIRQAFRHRAKQIHPDRNKSPDAKQAFLVLSEAYHVLRDAERRQTFDACRGNAMLFEQPQKKPQEKPQRARRARSRAWAAGFALAGVIGAATFVFANVGLTDPWADRGASDGVHMAVESPASPALATNPSIVAADDPSVKLETPAQGSLPVTASGASSLASETWQATASPTQMLPKDASDILADVPAAGSADSAKAVHPVQTPVAKPVAQPAAKRAAEAVRTGARVVARPVWRAPPSAAALKWRAPVAARPVWHAPASAAAVRWRAPVAVRPAWQPQPYAAARAKAWMAMKARQRVTRRPVMRRYAGH